MQITSLMPSVGSDSYDDAFRDGLVMGRVGGRPVEDYQFDGNHCIATRDPHPLRKQLNVLMSYAWFYNPVNLLRALMNFDSLRSYRLMYQVTGMLGLLKSVHSSAGWLRRLAVGPIEKTWKPGGPQLPVVTAHESCVPSLSRVPLHAPTHVSSGDRRATS